MLPPSQTPHATNRVKKQVLELLSTVLSPACANPQTLGSREHIMWMPSKPTIPLFGKPPSRFKTREVHEDHRQRVRIPFLSFRRNASKITLRPMPLRQRVLEEPTFPWIPLQVSPSHLHLLTQCFPTGKRDIQDQVSATSQCHIPVTPSRRQQITEVPTRRLQKYLVFLAVSKHLRPELLGHGTLSIYSRKGQPCCKPSCPPLGMKHPWLKVWQQAAGADQRYGCRRVLAMLLLPHSLALLESLILNSFEISFQNYNFLVLGGG